VFRQQPLFTGGNFNIRSSTFIKQFRVYSKPFSAREYDERTAAEIQSSLMHGILKNTRNDAYTRMQRNVTRTNLASKKARDTQEKNDALNILKSEITSIQQSRKAGAEQLRDLNAQKAELIAGNVKGRKSCASWAESSSSGRVTRNTRQAKAKAAVKAHVRRTRQFHCCCVKQWVLLMHNLYSRDYDQTNCT